MRALQFMQPSDFLGKAIKVFLKAGGSFHYKVTGCGPNHLDGYDDEGLNITIQVNDIDYIIGGNGHGR